MQQVEIMALLNDNAPDSVITRKSIFGTKYVGTYYTNLQYLGVPKREVRRTTIVRLNSVVVRVLAGRLF